MGATLKGSLAMRRQNRQPEIHSPKANVRPVLIEEGGRRTGKKSPAEDQGDGLGGWVLGAGRTRGERSQSLPHEKSFTGV